jgi:hypothetical protein
MIPLGRAPFPSSKHELTRALDEALRSFVHKPGPIVDVRARVFPYLDEIAINFDGAQFDSRPPSLSPAVGETKPAFEAAVVRVSGRNISMQGAPLNLQIEARDLVFHRGEDANGQPVLVVQKARDGHIVISAAQLDLENAILELGGRTARQHGIVIDQVRLAMRARGPRSLAADIRVQAHKLLLRAKIDVYAQLDIGEDFVARISQLKCKADGAIGSRACSVLDPYLRQWEGKSFPLNSLSLGETQLRDVRVAVADTVEITVDFGSV